MKINKVLFIICCILVLYVNTGGGQFPTPPRPTKPLSWNEYRGPVECGAVLASFHHFFSEYPEKAGSNPNFLKMDDTCDPVMEALFIEEMKMTFLLNYDNQIRMYELKDLWERWRKGNPGRICHPKRMLECDKDTFQCACRKNFTLLDVADYMEHRNITALEPASITQEIPYTETEEIVVKCQAKVNEPCRWNMPFLGFCTIGCKNVTESDKTFFAYCVGQPMDVKRCRVCSPPEDVLGNADGSMYKCMEPYKPPQSSATKLDSIKLLFIPSLYVILKQFIT